MPFTKGVSGNLAGRPKSKVKQADLKELLLPHAENLINTLVSLALSGDVSAMKLCIDRLIAPIKSAEPTKIEVLNYKPLPVSIDEFI